MDGPSQDGSGSHLVTRRILQGWAVGPVAWRSLVDGRCWNQWLEHAVVAEDVEIKEPGQEAHEEEAS